MVSVISISLNAHASIIFVSSQHDECLSGATSSSCSGLTQITANSYLDPQMFAELEGAEWVQSNDSWNVIGEYSILETDLKFSGDSIIESLFVAFDDYLQITSGGVILFDSLDFKLSRAWLEPIDIISLVGGPLEISGGDDLVFIVSNRWGATGAVWKGSATEVSAPGMIGLLCLSLMFVFRVFKARR